MSFENIKRCVSCGEDLVTKYYFYIISIWI